MKDKSGTVLQQRGIIAGACGTDCVCRSNRRWLTAWEFRSFSSAGKLVNVVECEPTWWVVRSFIARECCCICKACVLSSTKLQSFVVYIYSLYSMTVSTYDSILDWPAAEPPKGAVPFNPHDPTLRIDVALQVLFMTIITASFVIRMYTNLVLLRKPIYHECKQRRTC